MGDSDDDWDKDDDEDDEKLQEELKKKQKALERKERGLDSDYESEEEKPVEKPADGRPAAPKQLTKKEKRELEEKAAAEAEQPLDAEAEKLRQRKLEEEQNEKAAMDLFGACTNAFQESQAAKAKKEAEEKAKAAAAAAKPKIVVIDTFDSVELNVQADVSRLQKTCADKIQQGKCKGAAQKFLVDLLKALEDSLSTKGLADLEKLLDETVKEKKKPQGQTVVKANKATTKVSKTTKFNQSSEWEDVYGGAGDDEWTQEEWDEWYASQAAAPKG